MGDNHIVGSVPVQSEDATKVPNGPRRGQVEAKVPWSNAPAGATKVRLRASMERSDAYKRLPSGAWRVLAAMWELADAPRASEPWVHGRCKVSTLADRTGLSVSQVQRWMRRLRVVPEGQKAARGWLGGWIDSKVQAGRFLAWTVYATPGGLVETRAKPSTHELPTPRRATSPREDALPANAGMRVEVAHPCASDIPPVTTTAEGHHHHTTREDAEAAAGGGGGGDEFIDAIRTELRTLGVWTDKVEPLARRVAGMPDGLDRLRATIRRAKVEARQPAAFVSRAIDNGTLDELPPKAVEVPHGDWVPASPTRPTPDELRSQFKTWAKACRDLFRETIRDLRDAGVSMSDTVGGQQAMRYSEDPQAWAELFGKPVSAWRSEVVEIRDALNRLCAKAGVAPIPSGALPDIRSFAGSDGGPPEVVEAFE